MNNVKQTISKFAIALRIVESAIAQWINYAIALWINIFVDATIK